MIPEINKLTIHLFWILIPIIDINKEQTNK